MFYNLTFRFYTVGLFTLYGYIISITFCYSPFLDVYNTLIFITKFTSRYTFFLLGTCFESSCTLIFSLRHLVSGEVFVCWLLDIIKVVCWSLVLQSSIIVCGCGICFCILCIFDVECFEYCVMFCIDLYLFWY